MLRKRYYNISKYIFALGAPILEAPESTRSEPIVVRLLKFYYLHNMKDFCEFTLTRFCLDESNMLHLNSYHVFQVTLFASYIWQSALIYRGTLNRYD